MVTQDWGDISKFKELLIGKKIVDVSYMGKDAAKKWREDGLWHGEKNILTVELEDGTDLMPSLIIFSSSRQKEIKRNIKLEELEKESYG